MNMKIRVFLIFIILLLMIPFTLSITENTLTLSESTIGTEEIGDQLWQITLQNIEEIYIPPHIKVISYTKEPIAIRHHVSNFLIFKIDRGMTLEYNQNEEVIVVYSLMKDEDRFSHFFTFFN